ncbi:hypothetical protein Dimus_033949 [Dionaea muscipula]
MMMMMTTTEKFKGEEVLLSRELKGIAYAEKQRRCNIGEAFISGLKARERKLVCVTSGNSYLGAHLIKELLVHGYFVRATIQNQGDMEDMKRLLSSEEMSQVESVVVAKMVDLGSLCEAFRGCHAVFHTSSFIDPHGVAGYTERMGFLETEGARNVVEACSRAAYVKRCVFTSSLLASIWNEHDDNSDQTVDENCWSDEEFCREKKLWLALGKTRAEKAAWIKSKETKVKLVTLCPGLNMAPSFPIAHHETSFPYLKGGRTMFQRGVLATQDVDKLAKAHVQVYEEMDYGACGRYLCYDRIVNTLEEAIQIENGLKLHGLLSGDRNNIIADQSNIAEITIPARVTNSKLTRLSRNALPRLSRTR